MDPKQFQFDDATTSSVTAKYRRKRGTPAWVWLLLVAVFAGGGWFGYRQLTTPEPIALVIPDDQRVSELHPFKFRVGLNPPAPRSAQVEYSLVDPPEGAVIDAKTGRFEWTPSESQGPQTHTLTVRAVVPGYKNLRDEKSFEVEVLEVNEPPSIAAIEDRTTDEEPQHISFAIEAVDNDLPAQEIEYALGPGAPGGAKIDAASGLFEWTPADAEPGTYELTVVVTERHDEGARVEETFRITIPEVTGLKKLIADLRDENLQVAEVSTEDHPPFSVPRHLLEVGDQTLSVFEYDASEFASVDAVQIAEDVSTVFGEEREWKSTPRFYRGDRLIVLYEGDDEDLVAALDRRVGEPFAVGVIAESEPMPEPVELATPADVLKLRELYEKKQLFKLREYPTIRNIFATRFEESFADEIKQGFDNDYAEITSWLDEHVDLKEELYLALDPQFDDIPAALALFKDIYQKYPKQIERYGNLAIAIAVTWDNQGAVYEYSRHQSRTHSTMPPDTIGAFENFAYFVDAENFMQGRAQFVPWEFLVHLVNHRTPVSERLWAIENYVPKRVMFGDCYHDVPYDQEMLRTESRICRLAGQQYTLPNIRSFGGVCAMQADFAARIGKSMGVPAEYVRGESASGEHHAWVMWVELKQVTETSISFSLESKGRYFGDKYYVGTLPDPHTGQTITDRELELRLQTVGLNAPAKRQAKMIMSAYDQIRDAAEFELNDELMFLSSVIELSPGNEEAWIKLSQLSRENPQMDGKNKKLMQAALTMLFTTFANAPDFTWVVFDDMISFLDRGEERPQLLLRLVTMYEAAGRPDLACTARLKLTDYLLAEERTGEAIEGLAYTIKKFPEEGRYVPEMLDKLEEICSEVEGAEAQLILFYQQFLPTVPKTRGDEPSKYCMEMYERGIERFRNAGQLQLAQTYSNLLGQLRWGR